MSRDTNWDPGLGPVAPKLRVQVWGHVTLIQFTALIQFIQLTATPPVSNVTQRGGTGLRSCLK